MAAPDAGADDDDGEWAWGVGWSTLRALDVELRCLLCKGTLTNDGLPVPQFTPGRMSGKPT